MSNLVGQCSTNVITYYNAIAVLSPTHRICIGLWDSPIRRPAVGALKSTARNKISEPWGLLPLASRRIVGQDRVISITDITIVYGGLAELSDSVKIDRPHFSKLAYRSPLVKRFVYGKWAFYIENGHDTSKTKALL